MNPNWLGVISGVLALAAFLATYRMAKVKPVRLRVALGVVALFAAWPGFLFTLHYTHIFPESASYYQFRSVVGTELMVVPIGVAGGLAATFLPRLLLGLPLLGVAALSIIPHIKPFIGPIPNRALSDEWDGGICLQSTPSTCGAASTATILRHFGIDATEAELAADAHSYTGGTEAWYLARAARSRGLDVSFDFPSGFSPEGGLPAVVGVRLGSIGHFVPVMGKDGDRFIIGDPLHGKETLSLGELHQRYEFTGFHMRMRRREG